VGEWSLHKCCTVFCSCNIFLIVYSGAAWTSSLLLAWSQHRYHVPFPSVDRQRIIQPFIGRSYQHMVFALHVFSQCTSFSCWLRSDTGGIAMAEQVLTPSEVLEIVYNSNASLSDSSSDSISSSDNEIDDIAVADAIMNDDSGDEEEILHWDFRWETMDNYTGHREVFSCDFGPRNGAENVSDIVQCFELFFDKEIIQQIVRETNRYAEQYKNTRGNFFSFRSLWGHGYLSQKVKFTQFLTKSRKQRSLCAWLIVIITWGEFIWRTSCCTCAWSREKKKTKWYLKLFKSLLNSTVLN